MKVIVISGPTASGKTLTAIELSKKFGGEIVNFDSLLLYREINIGTAKPSIEERVSVPHHMIDVRSISQPMNASEYAHLAKPIVDGLLKENKIVFLVGGSGFYLQALLKGMYDSPTTSTEIMARSEEIYHEKGIAPFLEILKNHDPASFLLYHENDHYRIRRAVEHWWSNHTPISQARQQKDEMNKNLTKSNIHDWELLHIYLDLPKPEHQLIIEDRTKKMLDAGLINEVKELLDLGFSGKEKPLQSIGYKETLDFIQNKMTSLQQLQAQIITSTRQLAKSQRTWFNRDNTKITFHPLQQKNEILSTVHDFLISKKKI